MISWLKGQMCVVDETNSFQSDLIYLLIVPTLITPMYMTQHYGMHVCYSLTVKPNIFRPKVVTCMAPLFIFFIPPFFSLLSFYMETNKQVFNKNYIILIGLKYI